jgi:hypothetical protein
MQLSSPPYVLHAPAISVSLILSPELYLVTSTKHKAPRYAVCSISRSISEMAAMSRLRSSGKSCDRGGKRQRPYMALGQVILVASEAAPGLLQRVLTEMGYRLDVCRVTKSGHTEQL